MKIGDAVQLTETARTETYSDMPWKDDVLIITHADEDNEGIGDIYSFDNATGHDEITCSMYEYELEII
jgi:hypothetical protein